MLTIMKQVSLYLHVYLIIYYCDAVQYNDPLSLEDLSKMFNEDGCIEGTLAMFDIGSPYSESITVIESSPEEKNKTDMFSSKTPMSYLLELATYNNIEYQYKLTGEEGPAHNKKFVIALNLGEENYVAEGSSIKKAQHEAAKLALNSTLYEHPPVKNPDYVKPPHVHKSPEEKLNAWAKKHSNPVITYTFNEHTKLYHNLNHYHKGMYSKGQNVHTVLVRVLNEEFTGEGASAHVAKQNAAKNALSKLQTIEAFCIFDDGIKQLFSKIFTDSVDSPISLVYQFGTKSNMEVSFDLVSEEGPAHMKKFVFKCKVGERFETSGEGSSKKEARREAAEAMIKHLKSSIPYDNRCVNVEKKKSKKKKAKNFVKSVIKSHEDEYLSDEKDFLSIEAEMNPISKLYQLQQFKHDVEPVFRLVEEKGSHNKEFFMEVAVGDITYIGSGQSKKLAKKKAAEGILEKLGYSSKTGSTRMSNNHNKKKEFQLASSKSYTKYLTPGINFKTEKFFKLDETHELPVDKNEKLKKSYGSSNKINHDNVKSEQKSVKGKPGTNAKRELKKMADQMGIRYQFSDFPVTNTKGFVSLVSLTTDPPIICHGVGPTTDHSRDKAALASLPSLYKSQINVITAMLHDQAERSVKEEFYTDKDAFINYVIPKETE